MVSTNQADASTVKWICIRKTDAKTWINDTMTNILSKKVLNHWTWIVTPQMLLESGGETTYKGLLYKRQSMTASPTFQKISRSPNPRVITWLFHEILLKAETNWDRLTHSAEHTDKKPDCPVGEERSLTHLPSPDDQRRQIQNRDKILKESSTQLNLWTGKCD